MSIKLFVGYSVTPELKPHLSSSSLLCIPHQGKKYLGRYLEGDSPTLSAVRQLAEEVNRALPIHYRGELVVFPQTFVG
ncbi:MAG: hypothetical protein K1000chlam4_00384 [Chlamydiae bacterium]|nr:hypothetical protein [Chlamydiota bacterium]